MNKRNKQIAAGQFKTFCLQLIDEVNRSRIPIVITKRGKPLAKLVPYREEVASLFGCMKDSVIIKGDIVKSTGEKWDADA